MTHYEWVTVSEAHAPLIGAAEIAEQLGFAVEITSVSIVLRKPFNRVTMLPLSDLKDALGKAIPGSFKIRRSIMTFYASDDFRVAPLLSVGLPEATIDELEYSRNCKACDRPVTRVTYRRISTRPAWKSAALSLNGDFIAFSATLVGAFQTAGLTGATFPPLDNYGRYFYVRPISVLGPLLNEPSDWLEYHGLCGTCRRPKGESFFAPLRYAAASWHNADIVYCPFMEEPVFSHAAMGVINKHLKRAGPSAPIHLA